MVAQWRSMEMHIDYLLSLEDSPRTREACVKYINNWLMFFYPERLDLVQLAKEKTAELGGRLEVPCFSWKYSWIDALFGRRLAKRAQVFFPGIRWSLQRSWDKALYRMDKREQAALGKS